MADVTADTTFYPQANPLVIYGRTNAGNDDYFFIPNGQLSDCQVSNQDDDNIIVSADVSGSKVTIGCVTEAGAAHGTDIDIVFKGILRQT